MSWTLTRTGLQSCNCLFLAALLVVRLSLHGQPNGNPETVQWDAALQGLATYRTGLGTNGLTAVAESVRAVTTDAPLKGKLESRFIQFLDSDATLDAKQFICRQLRLIGSKQSVPVLAGFLQDPDMADMARYALEAIPGSTVDTALLDALPRTEGRLKVGVINSLGNRASAQAASSLIALVKHEDQSVARAAVGALKKIGGTNVVNHLLTLRPTVSEALRLLISDALVLCADELRKSGRLAEAEATYRACYLADHSTAMRAAALRGLLACGEDLALAWAVLASSDDPLKPVAADLIGQLPGASITLAIAARLDELPADSQVLMLRALADRGDVHALSSVLDAATSEHETISVEALNATGTLGNSDTVPLLLQFLGDENQRKRRAAYNSLCRLRGPGVDERIGAALPKQGTNVQAVLIDCLVTRCSESATPALLELADAPSRPVRQSAFRALGMLMRSEYLPGLLERIRGMTSTDELELAEHALGVFLSRTEKKAQAVALILSEYHGASIDARCALLRVASRDGNPEALSLALKALEDSNPKLIDTAVRVLARWPTPAPASKLLQIIEQNANPTYRALAFQGYVRMAGLADPSVPQSSLRMLQAALGLSNSAAEKKLVLSRLANLTHPKALAVAESHLTSKEVGDEAAMAVVKISKALAQSQPDLVREALQAVLEQSSTPSIRKQAEEACRLVDQQNRHR